MAKTTKELIDLLKFTVNEKAKTATTLKNTTAFSEFHRGQYMAFNEIYSMLLSIERTELDE